MNLVGWLLLTLSQAHLIAGYFTESSTPDYAVLAFLALSIACFITDVQVKKKHFEDLKKAAEELEGLLKERSK